MIIMCVVYSLQIVGDIPGFKIDINDDKLRTVLKIVTSLNLPPPALRNTTTYYNELPVRERGRREREGRGGEEGGEGRGGGGREGRGGRGGEGGEGREGRGGGGREGRGKGGEEGGER